MQVGSTGGREGEGKVGRGRIMGMGRELKEDFRLRKK